jgi:hypothetical protein
VALAAGVVLALVTGGLAFLFTRGGGGNTALALSLVKGQAQRFHMEITMNGSIKGPRAPEQPLHSTFDGDLEWRVLAVAGDGTATVRVEGPNTSAR